MAVKRGLLKGFFYGFSQFMLYSTIGLLFYLGAIFVTRKGVHP